MNGWSTVFLGVIAVATLATAIMQIAVLVAAGLVARRIGRLVDQVDTELRPVVANVNAIARDAARAAALATAQVERADRIFADFAVRLDQTLNSVQAGIIGPAREGKALLNAFRAGLRVLRDVRAQARGRRRGEDEDALFI